MNYRVIEKDNKKYIECFSAETLLNTEQDAIDLITACYENNTYLLLIHDQVLSDEFFRLGTGLAGNILQKFINYHIRVGVVLASEQRIKGKFKDALSEFNKGNDCRVFKDIEEAERWLLDL